MNGHESPHNDEPHLVVTSPVIVVSYFASIAGVMVPLALTLAVIAGAPTREATPLHLTVLWVLMLAGFLWSAMSYRSLRSTADGILSVQGLPPFRRVRAIPFETVRRVYITDYLHKLVLELDGDSRVTIANSYVLPRSPLPTVELEPHEPGGAYKKLKALKKFIEARLPAETTPEHA